MTPAPDPSALSPTRVSPVQESEPSRPTGGSVALHPPHRFWAIWAMIGSAACWGSSTVMTKEALSALGPMLLLSGQLAASVGFLWMVTVLARVRTPPGRAGRWASFAGLLEPGLAYALGTSGLVLTTASHAVAIAATEPIFVVAIASLIFGIRIGRGGTGAVGLATVGMTMLTVSSVEQGEASAGGDALILLGTISAALYVIVSSRFGATLAPVHLAARQQTVGLILALVMTGVALAAGWETLPADLAWWTVALVVISGIVQYALAFWLYLLGLRVLPVHVAALFLALTPVFGMAGGVIVLGESVGASDLAGTVVIVVALVAGTRALPFR